MWVAWCLWAAALPLPSFVYGGFGGPDGITIVSASGMHAWLLLLCPFGIVYPWWIVGWMGTVVMYRTLPIITSRQASRDGMVTSLLFKSLCVWVSVVIGISLCVATTLNSIRMADWSTFVCGGVSEFRYIRELNGTEFEGPLLGAFVWYVAVVHATLGILKSPSRRPIAQRNDMRMAEQLPTMLPGMALITMPIGEGNSGEIKVQ